ncbi:MAG: response regulator [Pseudodesulfovibrio sp.]
MPDNEKPTRHVSYASLDETSRALLDASMESALVVDAQGHVLAANDVAARRLGRTCGSELARTSLFGLLPEESAATHREKIEEAIRSARPMRFEEEVDDRVLVHSIVPVRSPWGEVTRLAVYTVDLTDLRRTDQWLRREQQRQIFFMESLPGIVYHLYPDHTIRYANRYFRKYFGRPGAQSCKAILQCRETDCNGCPPMDAMQEDRAVEWDWTDAQGRTFHLQCSPMTDAAGERMIMVLGIDITARKKAEDALKLAHDKMEDRVRQRTRELEKANAELTSKSMRLVSAMKKADAATRAKSYFLANMSHEIRTPLNAVLGMAELALMEKDEPQRERYLRRITEAGNSLLSVINDILDFSKIEARKLTLEAIGFELRPVLDSVMDMNRLQTSAKGLSFDLSVADDVPDILVGDPSRLKQVLINLLSNAIKFTERGGITLSVTRTGGDAPGGEVALNFAVADTGIGIPEDKQHLVFESFLQADDTITRKHGGTGLGLAICKLLVELMHGRMHFASTEGEGSTFSFTARFAAGDAAALPKAAFEASSDDLPRLNVLLADDNALNRFLAQTLLTQYGHSVTTVENGAQALEAVREQRFDLVLMDVQMPIMDGITATRAIRDPNSSALDPAVPIVAITAHALKGDRERFLQAGMNDYIAKPVNMEEFYATISRVVNGRDKPDAEAAAPGGERSNPAPFDRTTALEMLGGRTDLMARMDEIFLRDAPRELAELKGNLEKKDWDEAKRLAHSIKGSARTIGAVRVGAQAEQMEFFCKQKDRTSIDNKLKNLELEMKYALQFIEDELRA